MTAGHDTRDGSAGETPGRGLQEAVGSDCPQSLVSKPRLRYRRFGISRGRWYVYSTLDLGRIYVNLDFGKHYEWKWNFYVGGRYVSRG